MRLFRKAKGLAPIPQILPAHVANPASVETELQQLFDPKWYLEVNADVAASGMDALTHFVAYGEAEGRDPNPTFSTRFYRESYMRGEPVGASPLLHYLRRGRELGHDPDPGNLISYRRLLAAQDQSYGLELPELRRHIAIMTSKPLFVIYLKSGDANLPPRVHDMLQTQIYERWTLCTNLDEVLRRVEPLDLEDWHLVWLDGGETLHSSAFYCYASKINEVPSADLIYADEDEIDDGGNRARPFFKPDWSPDYFESFNFVGTAACCSARVCAPILREAQGPYDLLLRATDTVRKVEHVRQILVHRSKGLDSSRPREQITQEMDALGGRLRRTGRVGTVASIGPDQACYDIRLTLPSNPLVTVVIPTAGKIVEINGQPIDLLFNCLDKLAATSTYKNIEIVVIHNDDLGRARLEALAKREVKVLAYSGKANVARKLNLGGAESRGDYLLLMNDDIEPIAPDWIERMLEHFEKPHVGVVGAKLLFPTMKIQHAGVVLINGKPDHVRFKYPHDDEGYYYSTCAVRNFSAVTGAVMMTRASLFKEIGGYTEALAINYNDIDYCLKAERAGFAIVYAPQAQLIHYESMSRIREVSAYENEYFEKQWARFTTDPYYNEAMLKNRNPNYEVVPSQQLIG
jgi:GT2 family glycosyltransferase